MRLGPPFTGGRAGFLTGRASAGLKPALHPEDPLPAAGSLPIASPATSRTTPAGGAS